MGVWGTHPPVQSKIHIYLLTPPELNYSCPLVSVGDWFWEPPLQTPKSVDAQVPMQNGVEWHTQLAFRIRGLPNLDGKYFFAISSWSYLQT